MTCLTMDQCAQKLGCSLRGVERHIKAGRLRASKAPGRNGKVTIASEALTAFRAARVLMEAQTMTLAQVSTLLRLSPRTVQRHVKSGALIAASHAYGAGLRVTRDSVTAFAANRRWR